MAVSHFKKLDVRPLLARGEEPCAPVEAALAALKPGWGLTVLAPFLPSPLIERLKASGCSARAERRSDATWQVDFWRG